MRPETDNADDHVRESEAKGMSLLERVTRLAEQEIERIETESAPIAGISVSRTRGDSRSTAGD